MTGVKHLHPGLLIHLFDVGDLSDVLLETDVVSYLKENGDV